MFSRKALSSLFILTYFIGFSQIQPSIVDPEFSFETVLVENESCDITATLILTLDNPTVAFYKLPFEIDLINESTEEEFYYDMIDSDFQIDELPPGEYTLVIYFDDQCTQEFEIELYFSLTGILADINGVHICGSDGSVTLSNIVGNEYTSLSNLNIEWSKDGKKIDGESSLSIIVVEGGMYCSNITNNNTNCEEEFCFEIKDYSSLVEFTQTEVTCSEELNDGSILVTKLPLYNYVEISWSGPDGFVSEDFQLNNLAYGEYTATINIYNETNTEIICSYTRTFLLICDDSPSIGDCPFWVNMPFTGDGNITGILVSPLETAMTITVSVENDMTGWILEETYKIPLVLNYPFDNNNIFNFDMSIWPEGLYSIQFSYGGEVCHTITYQIVADPPPPECSIGENHMTCKLDAFDEQGQPISYRVDFCIDDCPGGTTLYAAWIQGDPITPCPSCITGHGFQGEDCNLVFSQREENEFYYFQNEYLSPPAIFLSSKSCSNYESDLIIISRDENYIELKSINRNSGAASNNLASLLVLPEDLMASGDLKGEIKSLKVFEAGAIQYDFEYNFTNRPLLFLSSSNSQVNNRNVPQINSSSENSIEIELIQAQGSGNPFIPSRLDILAVEEGEGQIDERNYFASRTGVILGDGTREVTFPTSIGVSAVVLSNVVSTSSSQLFYSTFCQTSEYTGIFTAFDGSGNIVTGFDIEYIVIQSDEDCSESVLKNELVSNRNVSEELFNVFPNPAKNQINISTEIKSEVEFNIRSIDGQLLMTNSRFETNITIPLNGFPSGVMVIELNYDGEVEYKRIIKTR